MTSGKIIAAAGALLLALGLTACATAGTPGPAPGATAQRPILGFGVEPVAGDTLQAMLARCSAAGSQGGAAGGPATPECDQLQRSVHNQPGNSAPRGP